MRPVSTFQCCASAGRRSRRRSACVIDSRQSVSSRASRDGSFSPRLITDTVIAKVSALNEIASRRGQTLAQLALAWTLRDPRMTSTLVGASSVEQLESNVAAIERLGFANEELAEIDRYATDADINIWAESSA